MNWKASVTDFQVTTDSDFAEESTEGKLIAAMAEWHRCFPDTEFSNAVFNDLLEDCKKRDREINQLRVAPEKGNFEVILKYDRFIQYVDELNLLCDMFNAFKGEPCLHSTSQGRLHHLHRISARRYFGDLKKRHPLLDEFETANPMTLKEQSAIAPRIYSAVLNGNPVAVKYLPIAPENEAGLMEYLRRSRAVSHEAILPIRQVFADCRLVHGAPQTFLCLVTDLADNLTEEDLYYEPLSLKVIIKNAGAVKISECLAILSPIIDALERIHQAGFHHGNLTWNNILLFNEQPRLTDATLHCKDQEERKSLLPPEHTSGQNSDIAGFGLVLYSLVSGLSPENYPKMPLEAMRQSSWREVNSFILRCCSSKNGKRFSFEEFIISWRELKCRTS